MSWNQKTCKEGTVCKDAIGTEVKVGDKVAFIRFGSFYTGLIKKICLHDNGKILSCWITPNNEYVKSGQKIRRWVGNPKDKYSYSSRLNEENWKEYKTQFYNDVCINVKRFVKIS